MFFGVLDSLNIVRSCEHLPVWSSKDPILEPVESVWISNQNKDYDFRIQIAGPMRGRRSDARTQNSSGLE